MKRWGISAERFLHLDGYNGWLFANRHGEVEPDHVPGVVVTPAGLTLPRGGLPKTVVAPDVMAKAMARGLAFDKMNRAYAVNVARDGFCLFGGCDAPPGPCFDLGGVTSLGGIAIDMRGRLFVALPDAGEVRVFRLSPPASLGSIPMRCPVAVALDRTGRLFVLDLGDAAPPPPGDPIDVEVVRIWRSAGDALTVSDDGAVAVVTRQSSTVDFAADGTTFYAVDLGRPALPAAEFAHASTLAGEVLYLGDAISGRVVEWQILGGRATPLAWSTAIDAWTGLAYAAGGLQALGRTCDITPVTPDGNAFYAKSMSVVLGPLDSGTPQTAWHRVTALVHPTPGKSAGVSVEILADDDCEAYDPATAGGDPRWEAPRELVAPREGHPAELAFLSAQGRYAYLRLTLHGDGRHTPCVRWVRVEYPRNSYLRYLPSIYSEDPTSANFTARLLSMFEAENADLSRTVDLLRLLFEPLAGDADFLPWLAQRLDVMLEPDWPIAKTRRVLADALSLYRKRGTRGAFLQMLTDHGGPGIQVVEGFQRDARLILGGAQLGCDSVLPGACTPPRMQLDRGIRLGQGRLDSRPNMEADPIVEHRGEITVLVPAAVAADATLLARVARIAQLEAPAGTAVTVQALTPRFGLGTGARLDVDAALGAIAPWRLASEADTASPPGALLLTSEPGEMALGRGPRLGMDSTV
jgi:phage tail-like protein